MPSWTCKWMNLRPSFAAFFHIVCLSILPFSRFQKIHISRKTIVFFSRLRYEQNPISAHSFYLSLNDFLFVTCMMDSLLAIPFISFSTVRSFPINGLFFLVYSLPITFLFLFPIAFKSPMYPLFIQF